MSVEVCPQDTDVRRLSKDAPTTADTQSHPNTTAETESTLLKGCPLSSLDLRHQTQVQVLRTYTQQNQTARFPALQLTYGVSWDDSASLLQDTYAENSMQHSR